MVFHKWARVGQINFVLFEAMSIFMNLAVNGRPVSGNVSFLSLTILDDIYRQQSDIWTSFSLSNSVFSCQYHRTDI